MDFKVNSILKTYGVNKPQTTSYKSAKVAETNDTSKALEVSPSVIEYKNTLEAVKNTENVREDVVAKYKGLIESGDYEVNVSNLADKLLNI